MRPNFLIFCVDQMRAYCMGCNGHPDVETPHLDRLARDVKTDLLTRLMRESIRCTRMDNPRITASA